MDASHHSRAPSAGGGTIRTPVWSLQEVNGSDFLVTTRQSESTHLQQLGTYRELCASSLGDYGSDLFCYTPGMTTFAARQGPFFLFSLPLPPRVAQHRCYTQIHRGTHCIAATLGVSTLCKLTPVAVEMVTARWNNFWATPLRPHIPACHGDCGLACSLAVHTRS